MSSLLVKGLGLFNDQYHFTIAYTIHLLLRQQYPNDFGDKEEKYLFASMFISAAMGQIIFGILGDIYGRSKMMVISCIILIFGGILCASVYSNNVKVMIYLLIISRAILGIGIGGEYPLSPTSAYESHSESFHEKQLFYVLGVQFLAICGSLFASIITYILVILLIPNQHTYDSQNLELIWRLLFIIGILPACLALYPRYKYRNIEPELYVKDKNEQNVILQNMLSTILPSNTINENPKDNNPFTLKAKLFVIYRFYFKTICATSIAWFTLDSIVYSQTVCDDSIINKTFENIDAISLQNMIVSVAIIPAFLLGFYFVLSTFGCRRLQILGFLLMGIMFFLLGISWDKLQNTNNQGYNVTFIILYYMSLFVTHCSAHITTFILPVELFPTAIRCTCYGISSSFGKIGAAFGAIFYDSFSNIFNIRATFVAFAFFSFIGSLVTILLIKDQDKYIRYVNKHFYLNIQEFRGVNGKIYKFVNSNYRSATTSIDETTFTQTDYTDVEIDESLYTDLVENVDHS